MRYLLIILLLIVNNVYCNELLPVIHLGEDGEIVDGGDTEYYADEVRVRLDMVGMVCNYSKTGYGYCAHGKWLLIGTDDKWVNRKRICHYRKYYIYQNLIKFALPESNEESRLYVSHNNIIGYVKNPRDAKPIVFEEKCE